MNINPSTSVRVQERPRKSPFIIISYHRKTLRAHAANNKTRNQKPKENYEIIVLIVLDWSKINLAQRTQFVSNYKLPKRHERKRQSTSIIQISLS